MQFCFSVSSPWYCIVIGGLIKLYRDLILKESRLTNLTVSFVVMAVAE